VQEQSCENVLPVRLVNDILEPVPKLEAGKLGADEGAVSGRARWRSAVNEQYAVQAFGQEGWS
jgi:hypothetical protein